MTEKLLSGTLSLNTNKHKIYRLVTYISWPSDFALYLENYLMDEGHTLDYGSV